MYKLCRFDCILEGWLRDAAVATKMFVKCLPKINISMLTLSFSIFSDAHSLDLKNFSI